MLFDDPINVGSNYLLISMCCHWEVVIEKSTKCTKSLLDFYENVILSKTYSRMSPTKVYHSFMFDGSFLEHLISTLGLPTGCWESRVQCLMK